MARIESDIDNPLDSLVGYHLRRASGAMMADLAMRLEALSLRTTDASILVMIEANPAIIQSDIGRVLSIKRANMAPLIGGLVDRKLVKRDILGRTHALSVTTLGGGLAREARTIMRAHETAFLGTMSALGRKRWTDRLQAIWTKPADDDPGDV